MKAKTGGFEQRSFDLLTAFNDVLGKTVRDLPGNYEKGDIVTDTSIVSGNLLFPKRESAPAENPRPEPAAKQRQIAITRTFSASPGTPGVTGIDCNQSLELPHERGRTA